MFIGSHNILIERQGFGQKDGRPPEVLAIKFDKQGNVIPHD